MPGMTILRMPGYGLLLVTALLLARTAFAQEDNPLTEDAEPKPAVQETPQFAAEMLTAEITEWQVPWADTRPRDPDVAPNGEVWLVGQGGDYVARFDHRTRDFTRKELPAGTGPHNLVINRDASLWISGNRQGWIGRMNPNSGELMRFTMPEDAAQDPHTLIFNSTGELWFTAQWGNQIGRLNPADGEIDLITLPVEKARPYGIRLDASDRPWVALLGTNALATVDPQSLELELIRVPREQARLRRVDLSSDGGVWYTDYNEGYIGRYDPESGEFREWKTPSERAGPYALAVDAQDRIWFVETSPDPNQLVGFDPVEDVFFSVTPIASGAGSVRHMVYDPKTHSLWFGTDTNNLAQAKLP